jgi:hypothetical protein
VCVCVCMCVCVCVLVVGVAIVVGVILGLVFMTLPVGSLLASCMFRSPSWLRSIPTPVLRAAERGGNWTHPNARALSLVLNAQCMYPCVKGNEKTSRPCILVSRRSSRNCLKKLAKFQAVFRCWCPCSVSFRLFEFPFTQGYMV